MSDATPPDAATSAGRPAAAGDAAESTTAVSTPGLVVRLFHLTTLAGLAVAAPLLDLLARYAEFLVAHRLGAWDVVGLALLLLLLPPLPLAAIEVAAGWLSRRLAGAVHLVFVGLLMALVCLPILARFGTRGIPALTAAGLVGAACAWAYARLGAVRLLASFLGIVLIGVPGSFLLQPKIAGFFSTPEHAADAPRVDTETPILMVIFDEFAMWALVDGEGKINRHRYPNLAALADRSLWFANAETVAYSTERAVPALVTGRMPTFEQLPSVSDYPHNLFTLFGRSHAIWSVEPITYLCPDEINRLDDARRVKTPTSAILGDLSVVYLHIVLPPPFKARLPAIDMGWRDFGGQPKLPFDTWRDFHQQTRSEVHDTEGRRESVDTLLRLLEAGTETRKPPLHFLHVLLPHRPLELLPTGQGYSESPPAGLEDELRRLRFTIRGNWQSQQRYFLQLGYVDHMVGQIVARLEAAGRFDETLIVLAADHGVSLRLGRPSRGLADGADPAEILPVPLLIKKPFQAEGEVVERRVRTIDVVPTILDVLGAEPPWEFDGRSALVDGPPRGPLRVETKEGFLEFGDEIHRQKLVRVREMTDRFGTGEEPLDFYRVGPYGDLVGKGTRYRTRRPSGERWTVSVVEPERYREIATDAPELPVLVQGTLHADEALVGDRGCCDLAVAVDGVIQTTASTADRAGEHGRAFSALLPPSSLAPGPHRLEIYAIVDLGRRVRLERLRIERFTDGD